MVRPDSGRLFPANPNHHAAWQARPAEPRGQLRHHGVYSELQQLPGRQSPAHARRSVAQANPYRGHQTGSEIEGKRRKAVPMSVRVTERGFKRREFLSSAWALSGMTAALS